MQTPWGTAQTEEELADGIINVTTASHGGIIVSPERQREIDKKFPDFKNFGGKTLAYEEDCEWAIVALTWPELFSSEHVEIAKLIIKTYHKEIKI